MVLTRAGQRAQAVSSFDEGLNLAHSMPYPYGEARILVELGRLDEALVLFRRLGAAKDVERTERALARSQQSAGPSHLTSCVRGEPDGDQT